MFGIIFSTNTNLIPGEMQNRSGGVVLAISLTTNMAILTALWRISCERLWVFLFRTINIYIFCNYIHNITYIHMYILYIYRNIYKSMELVESYVVSQMQWSVAGVFLGHLIPEPWLPVIVPLQSIHLTLFFFSKSGEFMLISRLIQS